MPREHTMGASEFWSGTLFTALARTDLNRHWVPQYDKPLAEADYLSIQCIEHSLTIALGGTNLVPSIRLVASARNTLHDGGCRVLTRVVRADPLLSDPTYSVNGRYLWHALVSLLFSR